MTRKSALVAMLKWAKKRYKQRVLKPIEKHASETMKKGAKHGR